MKKVCRSLFIIYYFLFAAGDIIITAEETAATEPPVLKAAEIIQFSATNAQGKNVTLGSTNPKSGFRFELELTSKGAAINKAVFSEFDDRNYKNPKPLVILSPVKLPDGSEVLSMANKEFVFVQQKLLLPLDKLHWQCSNVESLQDGSQTARFEATIKTDDDGSSVIKLTKTYKVIPDSFLLDCNLTIENLTSTEQKVRFNLTGPVGIGREDISREDQKVVAGFRDSHGQIVTARLDAKKLSKAKNIDDRRLTQAGADFLWAAATNKYFAAILVPVPDKGNDFCNWVMDKTGQFYNPDEQPDTGDETVGVDLKIAPYKLAPAGQADSAKTYNFKLYLGPKDKSLFDKSDMYRNLGFFQTIDFMSCCCPTAIIQPLAFGILAIMKWMYGFIGNYGVVIIILVFLMRLIMHPITKKSQVSMSKMQKVLSDPQVQEIRKKYSKTPMEMQKRIAAFQKERGVSQASGIISMLPMFVQMPIWIALYSSIYTSIDLRGAGFLPFWITDLSAPDALFRFKAITIPMFGKLDSLNLLPILMGIAFYLQQKFISAPSTSTDPKVAQQQKMMMIMFPVLFPLMLYRSPSGLNLYIMTSTFFGVIEQYVIRKHIREKEKAESQGLVATTSKTGGKVKKKKPKPFFRT
jgi:YidC/Oxa1 family membrane protein insertase